MLSTLEKTGVDSALLVDAVETVCFVTVEEGMYGDLMSGVIRVRVGVCKNVFSFVAKFCIGLWTQ